MKSPLQIAEAIAALPDHQREHLLMQLLTGYLMSTDANNRMPDAIGRALNAYGCAVVVVDQDGARLRDGWDSHGPRGAAVDALMNEVHDAIAAVIDRHMTRQAM